MTQFSMDDLDWDPDTCLAVVDGRPATGEFYQWDADGTLVAVAGYQSGREHGWHRTYYPDDALRTEGRWYEGRRIGVHREWHRSGRLAHEWEYDGVGMQVRLRRWNERGVLVHEWARTD